MKNRFTRVSQFMGLGIALSLAFLGCSQGPTEQQSATGIDQRQYPTVEEVKELIIPEELANRFADSDPVWEALQADRLLDNWTDPQLADPQSMSHTYHDIYSVRMVWGNLAHDSSNTGSSLAVDWSGKLSHNSASMLVVNGLIDFEDNDSLFRTDVPGFGWASHTSGDMDGVHFTIFHPKDIVYIAAPVFNIHTAQIDVEIPLGHFEKLDTVVFVDHTKALAISAHRVRTRDCPSGHLAGEWLHKMRGEGNFFGRWIASDGQLMGYLRGEFNTNDADERYFRGKWWDTEGRWQGYLRGKWDYDNSSGPHICLACPDFVGWFRGHFTDTEDEIRGRLGGVFGHSPLHDTVDSTGGHFIGKWEVDCSGTPHD